MNKYVLPITIIFVGVLWTWYQPLDGIVTGILITAGLGLMVFRLFKREPVLPTLRQTSGINRLAKIVLATIVTFIFLMLFFSYLIGANILPSFGRIL